MELLAISHAQQDFQIYVTFTCYQDQTLNVGEITATVSEGCGALTQM